MRVLFSGYFRPSEEEHKSLWDNALFVFDANILLGLYRYSDDTRSKFLETLEFIKDRCWLPHQTVKEYFNNRLNVISQQASSYDEASSGLREIEDRFKNSHQHPFISKELLERLCKDFGDTHSELEASKKKHSDRIGDDDILDAIEKIFGNKVGQPFSAEIVANLIKEGDQRYANSIPPGYKDKKKSDEGDPTRRFGDFFVWRQIMEKSKELKCGVVFVCDDNKEDWWMEFQGKKLGPRPELIQEFISETSQKFYMYQSPRFLEFAAKHFGREVPKEAVSEMREMKKIESERLEGSQKHDATLQLRNIEKKRMHALKHREILGDRLDKIMSEAEYLKQRDFIDSDAPTLSNQRIQELQDQFTQTRIEMEKLNEHLKVLDTSYKYLCMAYPEYRKMPHWRISED